MVKEKAAARPGCGFSVLHANVHSGDEQQAGIRKWATRRRPAFNAYTDARAIAMP
jgi:hypothetical protein